MSEAAVLSFAVVALLAVITPGLDTLLVLRTALLSGRRAGLSAVLGITLGCLVWAAAGIVGLTALLTASEVAYNVVRVLGAAYLVWLGASALWAARKGRGSAKDDAGPRGARGAWAALRAGMLTNLLNPKVGVFYISLLPQFLPPGQSSVAWGSLLVGIHLAIGLIWLPIVVWMATQARRFLLREGVRLWLDRITATVLIGLGVKLAVDVS
ncbi:MAG: LysE family translocator [Kibdelosporangium sp.]